MEDNKRRKFDKAVESLMSGARMEPQVVPVVGFELLSDVPEMENMTGDEKALVTLDIGIDTMIRSFRDEVLPSVGFLCDNVAYPPFIELLQSLCRDCADIAEAAEKMKVKVQLLVGD